MNWAFWKKKPLGSNFKELYQNKKAPDYVLIKQNILGGTSVILFALFSYYLSIIILSSKPVLSMVIPLLLCLILGLISLFFMLFIFRTKQLLNWVLFILIGIASSFWKSFLNFNLVTLFGLLLSVFIIFYGSYRMHKEAENHIKFNWNRFVKAGSNYIVFGIIVFLMLIFYQTYVSQTKATKVSAIDYSFFFLEKISGLVPSLSFNSNVDNLIEKTTSSKAMSNYLSSSGFGGLEGLFDMKSIVRDQVGKMVNQKLTGKETILDIARNYVNGITNPTMRLFILVILIIIIFSFSNLAFFALNLLIVPIGWVILRILLWTKFFTFKSLSVEQQTLSIE